MKLDRLFDGIINSFSIKALKHDFADDGTSLFFAEVLKREGVRPRETVLIDDSEDKGTKLSSFGIDYRRISDQRSLNDTLIELV